MKRLSMGGFTAAGVLVVAVLGGVVGGAVAMGGQQPAPAPTQQVQTVAEEATATPATPTPAATAAPEPLEEPVSDPAPTIEDVAKPETAQQAADRATAEADRAEQEADRAAEKAAETQPSAPAPEPDDAGGVVPMQPIQTEEEAAAKKQSQDEIDRLPKPGAASATPADQVTAG